MLACPKSRLMLATALVGLGAAVDANAQTVFPSAELHGVGATSVGQILPRELDCLAGQINPSVDTTGTIVSVAKGVYSGTDATFDCATQSVQPNIVGLYVQIGSGGGRKIWRSFATSAQYPAGSTWPTSVSPFPATQWSQFHFAFSDSAIDPTADLAVYNTNNPTATYTNTALATTYGTPTAYGAAIQVPLYVLPVALAYAPKYGAVYSDTTYTTKVRDLAFNVASPKGAYGIPSGGLRLNKTAYCGIFNGYITNWNDPVIGDLNTKVVNGATVTVSLKDPHDNATRWSTDGVPIRLVGRLDGSGTTDIFTRHLAAVCSSVTIPGHSDYTNHYVRHAQLLPYDGVTTINGSNTGYKAGTAVTSTAGDGTNLASGAVYASGVVTGTEQLGKFTLASGSGQIASALLLAPDKPSATPAYATTLLNGHFGYVGADWVKPAYGQSLYAAALPNLNAKGTATAWWLPTSANAIAAFGTQLLPPESDTTGAYVANASSNGISGKRSNPVDWTNVLYSGSVTLASPATGYPITGTTQFLASTCYKNAATRNALVTFLSFTLGKLTKDSAGNLLPPALLNGVNVGKIGIKTQSNIAALPPMWRKAINETFLVPTAATAKLNLYLQYGLPNAGRISSGLPDNEQILNSSGGKVLAGPNPTCAKGYGLGDGA